MTQYERELSNLSYTNKDFNSIYTELLDLAKKISYKWDPTTSDESDPGVVLLKLMALIGDKNNYNIDKNILETYPLSVTQDTNARILFEQLGYTMSYYQSATTYVSLTWIKDPDLTGQDLSHLTNSDVSEEDVETFLSRHYNTRFYHIPRFTEVSDAENTHVYTLIQPVTITSKGVTETVEALEGTKHEYSVNGETLITASALDYNNRIYFLETDVAENGIFIANNNKENYEDWVPVDNLVLQPLETTCYKFGLDETGRCYIEFPSDIDNLIGDGITITYIRTRGREGNISRNRLCQFHTEVSCAVTLDPQIYSNASLTKEVTSENIFIVNRESAVDGRDPESIDDGYRNYQKVKTTFDTLVSLKDYADFLYTKEYMSNGFVCDRTNDIQSTYKVLESDNNTEKTHIYVDTDEVKITGKDTVSGESTSILVDEPEMNAFNLRIYALQFAEDDATTEGFRTSFQVIADNVTLGNNNTDPFSQLNNVKYAQHDFKQYEVNKVLMIKNKYPILTKIIPQYRLTTLQTQEVIQKVASALHIRLNARKLQFGEPLPYNDIYDTILNADPRIKAISLEEFVEFQTYAQYFDGHEIQELRIDHKSVDPDKSVYLRPLTVQDCTEYNNNYANVLTISNQLAVLDDSSNQVTVDGVHYRNITQKDVQLVGSAYKLRVDGKYFEIKSAVNRLAITNDSEPQEGKSYFVIDKHGIYKSYDSIIYSDATYTSEGEFSSKFDYYEEINMSTLWDQFRTDIHAKSILAGTTPLFVDANKFTYSLEQANAVMSPEMSRLNTDTKIILKRVSVDPLTELSGLGTKSDPFIIPNEGAAFEFQTRETESYFQFVSTRSTKLEFKIELPYQFKSAALLQSGVEIHSDMIVDRKNNTLSVTVAPLQTVCFSIETSHNSLFSDDISDGDKYYKDLSDLSESTVVKNDTSDIDVYEASTPVRGPSFNKMIVDSKTENYTFTIDTDRSFIRAENATIETTFDGETTLHIDGSEYSQFVDLTTLTDIKVDIARNAPYPSDLNSSRGDDVVLLTPLNGRIPYSPIILAEDVKKLNNIPSMHTHYAQALLFETLHARSNGFILFDDNSSWIHKNNENLIMIDQTRNFIEYERDIENLEITYASSPQGDFPRVRIKLSVDKIVESVHLYFTSGGSETTYTDINLTFYTSTFNGSTVTNRTLDYMEQEIQESVYKGWGILDDRSYVFLDENTISVYKYNSANGGFTSVTFPKTRTITYNNTTERTNLDEGVDKVRALAIAVTYEIQFDFSTEDNTYFSVYVPTNISGSVNWEKDGEQLVTTVDLPETIEDRTFSVTTRGYKGVLRLDTRPDCTFHLNNSNTDEAAVFHINTQGYQDGGLTLTSLTIPEIGVLYLTSDASDSCKIHDIQFVGERVNPDLDKCTTITAFDYTMEDTRYKSTTINRCPNTFVDDIYGTLKHVGVPKDRFPHGLFVHADSANKDLLCNASDAGFLCTIFDDKTVSASHVSMRPDQLGILGGQKIVAGMYKLTGSASEQVLSNWSMTDAFASLGSKSRPMGVYDSYNDSFTIDKDSFWILLYPTDRYHWFTIDKSSEFDLYMEGNSIITPTNNDLYIFNHNSLVEIRRKVSQPVEFVVTGHNTTDHRVVRSGMYTIGNDTDTDINVQHKDSFFTVKAHSQRSFNCLAYEVFNPETCDLIDLKVVPTLVSTNVFVGIVPTELNAINTYDKHILYGTYHENDVLEIYNHPDSSSVSCSSDGSFTPVVLSSWNTDLFYGSDENKEWLRPNENVVFTAPNLIKDQDYSSYVKYVHNIKEKDSLDAGTVVVPKDANYTLTDDEFICFFWKAKETDQYYTYYKYCQEEQISDPIVNLTPNFPLQWQPDGNRERFMELDILRSRIKKWPYGKGFVPEETILGTLKVDGKDEEYHTTIRANDFVAQLAGSDYVLTGSNTITTKKVNRIHINKPLSGTDEIYWILNKTTDRQTFVLEFDSNNQYLLKTGEYLIYTNALKTQLLILGSGTLIERTVPETPSNIPWEVDAVDYEEFVNFGVDALQDLWFTIPEGYSVYATEMEIIQIGPSNGIQFKETEDDLSHLDYNACIIDSNGVYYGNVNDNSVEVSDTPFPLHKVLINYAHSDDPTAKIELPLRNDSKDCYKGYSMLNLSLSKVVLQPLYSFQTVNGIDMTGQDVPLFAKTAKRYNTIIQGYVLGDKEIDITGGKGVDVTTVTSLTDNTLKGLSLYYFEPQPDSDGVDHNGLATTFKTTTTDDTYDFTHKITCRMPVGKYIVNYDLSQDLDSNDPFLSIHIPDIAKEEVRNANSHDIVFRSINSDVQLHDVGYYMDPDGIRVNCSINNVDQPERNFLCRCFDQEGNELKTIVKSIGANVSFSTFIYIPLNSFTVTFEFPLFLSDVDMQGKSLNDAGAHYILVDVPQSNAESLLTDVIVNLNGSFKEKHDSVTFTSWFKYVDQIQEVYGNLYQESEWNAQHDALFEKIFERCKELDYNNKFIYRYQVPDERLILNPLAGKSFIDSNHIYNSFTICEWDVTSKDAGSKSSITVLNTIK